MVAAVVEAGVRLLFPDAELLPKPLDHIPDYLIHEPGVDFNLAHGLFHDLLGGGGPVGELQDLRLGGVPLGLGDEGHAGFRVYDLRHFIQDDLLALLVHLPGGDLGAILSGVSDVVQGAENRGVVGDGDEAGALRQAEVLGVLAEVKLRRRLNAVAGLAQIDGVQVQLQNIFLGVVLLKFQRPENLPNLPVDIGRVVLCHVFQHLLGQGGPAVAAVPGNQLQHRSGGPLPVHALMLKEALVLDGNGGLPQVVGHLVKAHQNAVLLAVDVLELLPRPGLLILIVDKGAEVHGVVLRPHRHAGGDHRVDILLKEMQADQRRADAHQQDRPQRNEDPLHHAQDDAQRGGPSALPAPLGRLGVLSSSVLLQSNEYLLCRGYRLRPAFCGEARQSQLFPGLPNMSRAPCSPLYHALSILKMSDFAEKKFPRRMDL